MLKSELGDRKIVNSCYDHIGGILGESLFKFLLKEKWLEQNNEDYKITDIGWEQLEIIGIDIDKIKTTKRKIVSICIEKNHGIFHEHIGAYLGALFFERMIELDWLEKINENNYKITDKGIVGIESLGIEINKLINRIN